MTTMKNNSSLRLLLVFAALATSVALATAQDQIILAGGSQGVTLDVTDTSSAQMTFGKCTASSCTMSGNGVVLDSRGSAVSVGTWNLLLNGGGPLTVSKEGSLDRPASGTIAFKSANGLTGAINGTVTLQAVIGDETPQFIMSVTNLTGVGALGNLFATGSTVEASYSAPRLVCTSNITEVCTFQAMLDASGSAAGAGSKFDKLAPASESTAALLLGTGLFGLALILRRRHKLTHTEA